MTNERKKFLKIYAIAAASALAVTAFIVFVLMRGVFANAYISKGDKHVTKHDYKSAVADYNTAKNWTPKSQTPYLKLAEAYCLDEDFESAAKVIDSAIEKRVTAKGEGLEQLYVMKIQVLSASGSLEDAVKYTDGLNDQYILKKIQEVRPSDLSYSPRQGNYDKTLKMKIEVPEGSTVYYTTDGTFPTKFSNSYTSPINIGNGTTEIRAVSVDEKGLVSPLLSVSYTVTNENQSVEFDDEKIEQMVRISLSKPNGAIRLKELQSITVLYNEGSDGFVRTLSDLDLMPNLEEIYLDGEQSLLSISQLSGKSKLRILSLAGCGLDSNEINALGGLSAIEQLDLSGNSLTSVSVLSNMPSLKELFISNNSLRDISALSSLPELEYLDASRNRLTAVPDFDNSPKLTSLVLADNMINDISSVHRLTSLEYLDLSGNAFTACRNLSALTNLNTLILASNNVTNFDFLSSLTNLSILNVSKTGFLSTKPISNLSLTTFMAGDTDLASIKDLANITTLTALEIQDTNVKDITPVKDLQNLDYLDISNCPVQDTSALSNLPNLYTLRAVGIDLKNTQFVNNVMIIN